jgi:hypothetical protein
MRSIEILRTAASYCRKRWRAFQGVVKSNNSRRRQRRVGISC